MARLQFAVLALSAASVHGFARLADASEPEIRKLIHDEARAEARHMIEEMEKSEELREIIHKEVADVVAPAEDIEEIQVGWPGMTLARRRKMQVQESERRARRRLQSSYTPAIHSMHNTSIDHIWILVAGLICFFLQAGFALLEAGAVRAKNAKNIALKNLMDAVVGGVVYYLFGYALAYGSPGDGTGNPYIGGESGYAYMLHDAMGANASDINPAPGAYGLSGWPTDYGAGGEYHGFFFQYVFAATIATIVSGAVAERIQFKAYMMYSFILTGIIYPPVSHWIWSADGFLYKLGVIDYAGGGAVHALSGVAAFVGAAALGPRHGKIVDGKWIEFAPHNVSMMALGVFVLWFGFIPFNAGSGVTVIGWMAGQTARIAVMTTLGGCSGGMVGLAYGFAVVKYASIEHCICGVLAGMVSVCSPCATVAIWAVFWIISPIGTLSYFFFMFVNRKLKVDDPLGASALHFGPGAVGMMAVGFFAKPDLTSTYYGCAYGSVRMGDVAECCECFLGLFYGGNGQQLGIQLMALTIYTVYGFCTCIPLFYGMKLCKILRVKLEDEITGLDVTHHGGPCYTFEEAPAPSKSVTATA